MAYLGDLATGVTLNTKFTTVTTTGAPTALAGTPAISVYKDNSTTQSTSGVTLTADFDSVTGLNNVAINTASDGTFYSAGSDFQIVITTGTVGGTSVVGYVVGEFSLNNRSALRPATAGRALVVDASGLADANTVRIGPSGSGTAQTARDLGTSVLLSSGTGTGQLNFTSGVVNANLSQILGTTTATPATAGVLDVNVRNINNVSGAGVTTVGANIGTTQPINFTGTAGSALARVDMVDIAGAAVSTTTAQIGANVVQLSGDATAADNAESFFDGTGYAGTNNVIPLVTVTTTATNLTNAATAGSLTAAMIANVTTAATAATPVAASVSGNIGGNVLGNLAGSIGALAAQAMTDVEDAVWDASQAGHVGTGTTGESLSAAGAAGDPWITALPGAYAAGTAGYIIGTNLDAPTGDAATPAEVATALNTYDGPTNAEMVARTLVAASYATAAAQTTAQDDLDIITGSNGVVIASGTQTFNMTGNVTGNMSGSVGSVSGNVGGNVAGSIGSLGATAAANVRTQAGNALADYGAIP